MKTQTHNQGELKELTVNIESDVVDSLEVMSAQSSLSIDDIVVIALKRYRASHAELLGKAPKCD
jgi:fructose-1,6-bisphosphatase/sedoheptulose 1,7-bisphosphatase-like protein